MMDIKLDASGLKAMRLVKDFKPRFKTLMRWVPYWLAKTSMEEVEAGIPHGGAHQTYRRSIRLTEVSGTGGTGAFAIQSEAKAAGVKSIDPARVVIYVRPRKTRLVKVPRVVKLLQRHSPWTLETIPFLPTQKEARVVSRKVSLQEVEAVEAARRADESVWRRGLKECGVRDTRHRKQLAVSKAIGKHVPDVAFEALRLEFGMGGVDAAPHWKPAIRSLRSRMRALPRRADVVKLLSDPSYTGYRRWVPRLRKIRSGDAKKFVGFQTMLNITPGALR